MNILINSVIQAIHKASRFLKRDFYELEHLQNSGKNNALFCQRSLDKIKENLQYDLIKFVDQIIYNDEEIKKTSKIILQIEIIDDISNFARSLPFFAISVNCIKLNNLVPTTTSSIMIFPILNQVYYCEKGSGVWLDQSSSYEKKSLIRLRIGNKAHLDNTILVTDTTYAKSNLDIFKNILWFGSPCYGLSLLISGKVDILILSKISDTLKSSFNIFIIEAGGILVENKDNYIFTNSPIAQKVRQITNI